jgi:hypothetical protein
MAGSPYVFGDEKNFQYWVASSPSRNPLAFFGTFQAKHN